MTRTRFWLTVAFFLLWGQLLAHPARATTSCAYNFISGSGNNFLRYCVTVNANIPFIENTSGTAVVDGGGEGYGLCNESPAQNYTDYGVSTTGNWGRATLLSRTSTSVQIARTTSDSHWTLTQTITTTHVPSITVVMALKNNQSVQKTAYLVRVAQPVFEDTGNPNLFAGPNGAFTWIPGGTSGFVLGLLLENVGTPQFGFWQGYVLGAAPNACAFAYYASPIGYTDQAGWMEVAYVGPVPAGATRTVTLTYRGL